MMMMMMNPTPPGRPMDKDKVKEFIHRLVMDMDKDKLKEFVHRKLMDQVKEFVESSEGLVVGRKSASTSHVDDTSSTEGEKLSICHIGTTRTPAATILSNDQNYGTTEHINSFLLDHLDVLVDDALESILNELKIKIKDFRRRTRNGNIILDDEVSLELKLKKRPSKEIKESWRLFKIFKNLKIKTGEIHKKKNKENIEISLLQDVDLNEAPVNNDINSDKEDKFQFVEFKEQIDYINLQMLKKQKLY